MERLTCTDSTLQQNPSVIIGTQYMLVRLESDLIWLDDVFWCIHRNTDGKTSPLCSIRSDASKSPDLDTRRCPGLLFKDESFSTGNSTLNKFLCEEMKCCRFSLTFSYWWGFQKPVHVPLWHISPWSRCSHAQRNPAWKSCGAWKQSSVGCISSVLLVWLMLIWKYNQCCWYRCIIQS